MASIKFTMAEKKNLFFICQLFVIYPFIVVTILLSTVFILKQLYVTPMDLEQIKNVTVPFSEPTLQVPQVPQVAQVAQGQHAGIPSQININTTVPLEQGQSNKFWSILTTVGCSIGIAFLIYLGVTYVSADPIDLVTKATEHITKNQNSNAQEILNTINRQNNFIEKINTNQNKILTEHSADIKGQVTQLIHSLNGQGDAINSLNVMNSIQKMADAASTTLG